MTSRELVNLLERYDHTHRKWIWSIHDIACLFPRDTRENLHNQLSRLVRAAVLRRVARGVYVHHHARSRQMTLHRLARALRPREFIYLSRESRLSELGAISQQPLDCLTLTTTGRSHCFDTPYGRLEYTHTGRDPEELIPQVDYNPLYRLFEASHALALADLRSSRRNLHLVRRGDD